MPGEKVYVGMSGGVDSSVSAAVLKNSGFDAVGVTLRLCGGAEEGSRDAAAVCGRLGIEHRVIDLTQSFKEHVIGDFIFEYSAGRTPNPCVVCNRRIKFGEMLEIALSEGADKIATGHYAVIKKSSGRYILCRAADTSKDQTYVLYGLTQRQLAHTLFPLGIYTKPQVRELAAEHGFINADRPDSQDICFVPDGDYAAFIENFIGRNFPSGDFVGTSGEKIGRHKGLIRYTVGQRKGLGLALGKPCFVIEKDADNNRVVIGDEPELFFKRVLVDNLNFIPFDSLDKPLKVTGKLRYRHAEQPATIYPCGEGRLIAEFDEPQRAPSPGQAAVFYDGEIVVGGGTIVKGIG